MHGFEKVTHEKFQGIHAQVIMRSIGEELNISAIAPVLDSEFSEIEAWSPSAMRQVIIQRPGSDDITHAVALKGIDPAREDMVSTIGEKIVRHLPNEDTLEKILRGDHILIGSILAEALDVRPGDEVKLVYPGSDQARGRKIQLSQRSAVVGALFKTGIEEFDNAFIVAPLSFAQSAFPDMGITQISIKLTPDAHEKRVIRDLIRRFHLDVFSWKDLYPALVSALALEKYAMFFILALIVLVASMNVMSLLFMQITYKRPDIAVLKSLGMPDRDIRRIFLCMGLFIALIGSIAGLLLAWGIGRLLQRYPFIELPDTYYVTHLPVVLEFHIFVIIFFTVISISLLALLLPLSSLKGIKIARILRFEG